MNCDHCDNEATVHEVMIKGGKQVEKHLCEQCALSLGMAGQAAPITQLLTQYVTTAKSVGRGVPASGRVCRRCGLTFARFRQSGLLGCPSCYEAFAAQLGPLLSRAHEGATHHIGRTPRRFSPDMARASEEARAARQARAEARRAQLVLLRSALEQAVRSEQYERAAELRDEVCRMEQEDEADREGMA